MALDNTQLVLMGKALAKAQPTAPVAYSYGDEKFSYSQLNEAFRNEINEIAGTYSLFRENKNRIFKLFEEIIDDVLPVRVMEMYKNFAEIKTFNQGDKPIFTQKTTQAAKRRAKQFIGKVGLAGIYEVFKLDGKSYEVVTNAIGGAAQIGLEEFLDGRADFAELTETIMVGMDDLIYHEVGEALKTAVHQLPPANRVAAPGFDEASFDRLLTVAAAYGEPTIYCTYEFAVKMIPQEAWRYTEAMKDELWRTGRLASYKGKRVIILEQGFVDETNSTKVIDPGYCYIIPNGADTKPVKIAFEGQTLIDEWKNHDWSREIQVYKKVGVVAMMANNICSYVDTSLAGEMTEWFLNDTVQNVVVTKAA